jgi:hypothetical protein
MGKSLSLGSSGLPPRRSAFQHAPRALSSEYLSSRFDVHLGKSCPFRSLARFQSTVLICLDRFPLHGVQGSCSIAAKGIHNTAGLVAFRFFLGIIEVSRVLRLPLVPVRWLTGRMVSSAGWVLPRSHPATQLLVQGQSRVCRRPHSIDLTLLMSPPVQPNELSKRLALFYSASLMAGAFGGLLAGVITQYMDGVGNTPGWQWVSRRHPDI